MGRPIIYGQLAVENCRFDPETVEPLVLEKNPYVSGHEWESDIRMEFGQLDSARVFLITQDGCQRHHTRFSMLINPLLVEGDFEFWVEEVERMILSIYFGRKDYDRIALAFLDKFEEYFAQYGLNRPFNFPLGTLNFICEVQYSPQQKASIEIEMIEYLFKEKMRMGTKEK